jgi:stage II sporulation protein D
MSSPLLRPVRKASVRFLVLSMLLTGAAPLSDLLEAAPQDGYAASTITTAPPSDPEVSMDTLEVPEAPDAGSSEPDGDEAAEESDGFAARSVAPAPEVVAELSDHATRDFGMLGVTWAAGTAPEDLVVEVRTRTEGEWTAWEGVDLIDLDDEGATRSGTDPIWVGESDGIEVRMLSAAQQPEDPQVVLIDGGSGLPESGELQLTSSETTVESGETTVASGESADPGDGEVVEPPEDEPAVPASTGTGVAPMPTIVTRAQWGVDERGQSSCSTPVTSSVLKGITLHHTAGANGYTKEQAPGIVRGIHAYHTRSLGWCDMGYNFLVDTFGTVYEGRRGGITKQVRGAHAGNWDANVYTTGISMMGNFDTVDVPQAMRTSVINLMAWRLSSFGVGPIGKYQIGSVQLPRISGHRDIYSLGVRPATATACPGRYGYAWLNDGTRVRVKNRIEAAKASPSPTPTPTPSPAPAPAPEPEPAPAPAPTTPPVVNRSVAESYWVPASRKLVLKGRGYGHGRGMSQHGAQGAALKGMSYSEITNFYYPGTQMGKVNGKIRVLITADKSDAVVVDPAKGLRIRELAGGTVRKLPTRPAIKRWRLVPRKGGKTVVQFNNGKWKRWEAPWARNLTGDAEFLANEPMTLTTAAGRRAYRGILRSASPKPGRVARDTVNIVTLNQYIRGVLPAEMPASWHMEALKAQAVAARTYATWSRDQYANRYYQVCDSTACQVYGGVSAEHRRSNRAVRQTSQEILTYQGRTAFTQYSASTGGWTVAGSAPYLRAQQDPYDGWSGNTVHTWSTTVTAARIQKAFPAIGRLRSVEVPARDGNGQWQGRVTRLVLDGTKGRLSVTSDSFRTALGLRSTWFTLEPTPIIKRWRRLGGPESVIGSPRNTEFAVASGTRQQFEKGQMFHSSATGPRELYGPVLKTYRKAGGPSSALGFPTSPVRERGKHRLARFQRGGIYVFRPNAPVTVTGRIHARFVKAGAIGKLGWPRTSNYSVSVGERVDFGKGSIVWNRKTGKTRIIRK